MKPLLMVLALAASAWAQNISFITQPDHYKATATTTALTIQQPVSGGRQIVFGDGQIPGATVYCVAAQTATFSWNGTAASSTAGAEKLLPGTTVASGVTVWTASNVGAGTAGEATNIPAGSTVNFALPWIRFLTQGTAINLTITTSGSCTITFNYSASASI
jgi:hypothetical protein